MSETLGIGALAAALAKAQNQFPSVVRDKKVTVKTKDGGSYSFNYAPLDSILAAVRGPLSGNGLAIVQVLDEGTLVTSLIHESGAQITGKVGLPDTRDIQAFGSAVTYLRRYALQAVLGIAAEDDDDGNRAAGNLVVPAVERGEDGSLIGTAETGDKATSDFLVRQTPDGPELGFRLRDGKGGILVETYGALALALDAHRDAIIGKRITVWGNIAPRTFTPKAKGSRPVTYQVLAAERVRVPDVGDLPLTATPEPEAAPDGSTGLTEAESAAIWDELDKVGA